MQIEPYVADEHEEAVVAISLRAWAPVFVSIKETLDLPVWDYFYPEGWEKAQAASVKETCASSEMHTWVATENGAVAGFVAVKLHSETFGEIYMIAVDPSYQRRGVASKLTGYALDWLKQQGVSVAMVDTGGDPGHAPARATYESMGFRISPVARYFKKL